METGNIVTKKKKKRYGGKRKKMHEWEAAERARQLTALSTGRDPDVNRTTMQPFNSAFEATPTGDNQLVGATFSYSNTTRLFRGYNTPYSYANARATSHTQSRSNNLPSEQFHGSQDGDAPIENSHIHHAQPNHGFDNEQAFGTTPLYASIDHHSETSDRMTHFKNPAPQKEVQFSHTSVLDTARSEINVPLPDRSGTINIDALPSLADLNIKQTPPREHHSTQMPVLDTQGYRRGVPPPDDSPVANPQNQKKTAYKEKNRHHMANLEMPGIGRHSLRSHVPSNHMHMKYGSNTDSRVGLESAFMNHSRHLQHNSFSTGFGKLGQNLQAQSPHLVEFIQPPRKSRSGSRPDRHGRHPSPTIPTPVPEPTLEYLLQASQPSVRMSYPQNILIILDLNGTLVYRKKRSNPGSIVPRPDVEAFLDYLFSRFSVMIWSSATPTSVDTMCGKIFSEGQRLSLVAEWARDMLGLTGREYTEKVQVYKRLETIWNSSQIAPSYPDYHEGGRWGQSNTILLDDSVLKASAQPHNQIVVPEFIATKVQEKGEVFKQVVEYLEDVVYQKDVSCYMRKHPFKVDEGRNTSGSCVRLEQN